MKIGNIEVGDFPLLLAPMEDVSDPPFRALCKQNGADLMYTEFISADGLIRDADKSVQKLDIYDYERPIGIQIFGDKIESMREAAAIAEEANPEIIDINYGCPVKKVACKGAGAGILLDLPKMQEMTAEIVRRVNKPVTVKTRLGWDEDNIKIVEVAKRLQDVGIQALTIHGRTRKQMYKGSADWSYIAEVKNQPDIALIACAAHARRYFFQAKDSEPLAETALLFFGKIYAVEKHLREQRSTHTPEQIAAYRREKAAPIWQTFFEWAEQQYQNALPKSAFGKALYYLLQRKEKLTHYLHDGRLQIDNNLVENSVRPLALGRKNYLFAGSHAAAERIAMMYSFFASCRKQGINPVEWLHDTLTNIATQPINRIEELLPMKKG